MLQEWLDETMKLADRVRDGARATPPGKARDAVVGLRLATALYAAVTAACEDSERQETDAPVETPPELTYRADAKSV